MDAFQLLFAQFGLQMPVIALTGVTCSGKTELERALIALGARRVTSHTTRAPRPGERNGIDYHFVSSGGFSSMLVSGALIESNHFGGAMYGKSYDALNDAFRQSTDGLAVAVIEPEGAKNLARYCSRVCLGLLNVWVRCDPQLQAERWLARTKFEESEKAQLGARLGAMLGVEQEWFGQMSRLAGHDLMVLDSGKASPSELALKVVRELSKRQLVSADVGCRCERHC